jgi:hypothetical protein
MPKRSSKPSSDPNVAAYEAVARLTGTAKPTASERKAMAAILGSRGGKKGGKARAENLSAERRSEIARAAAKARWSK